jgi:hypothetical protein
MEAPADVIESERQVLRALCQGAFIGAALESAIQLLAAYRFRDPIHLVVFEIVSTLPSREAGVIREQLAARLTNKGFPDFDFNRLFEPHRLTSEEALHLIRGLVTRAR